MKSLKEKIEIMQSFLAGATIEFRPYEPQDEEWMIVEPRNQDENDNFVEWNWGEFDYRIKTSRLRCWANIYRQSNGRIHANYFNSKKSAVRATITPLTGNPLRTAVLMVEVEEDETESDGNDHTM